MKTKLKVGDIIASVATPIARVLHMDCIDPIRNELRPDSPCAKTRNMANEGEYYRAIIYRLFGKDIKKGGVRMAEQEQPKMVFMITIAVEADTVEEALQKKAEGKTLSVTPQRIQPPPPMSGVVSR